MHSERTHTRGPEPAVASWNSTIFGWYTAKSSGSVLLFTRAHTGGAGSLSDSVAAISARVAPPSTSTYSEVLTQ